MNEVSIIAADDKYKEKLFIKSLKDLSFQYVSAFF